MVEGVEGTALYQRLVFVLARFSEKHCKQQRPSGNKLGWRQSIFSYVEKSAVQ